MSDRLETFSEPSASKTEYLIQLHTYCLVFCTQKLLISAISENFQDFLSGEVQDYIEKPITSIFSENEVEEIVNALTSNSIRTFSFSSHKAWKNYVINISVENEVGCIEFVDIRYFKEVSTKEFNTSLSKIIGSPSKQLLLERSTVELKKFTNAARVLAVEFTQEDDLYILNETLCDDVSPIFEGVTVPKNNFPWELKALFLSKKVQFTINTNAEGIAFVQSKQLLPLQETIRFQNLSKKHISYLQSIGVEACIYIPIVIDEKLWGMFICYSYEGTSIVLPTDNVLEGFSELVNTKLGSLVQSEQQQIFTLRDNLIQEILYSISAKDLFIDAFKENSASLLSLVKATGAVIIYNGSFYHFGNTPIDDKVKLLHFWLVDLVKDKVYSTDSIVTNFSTYLPIKKDFCGILAAPISEHSDNYIIWFRPEFNKVIKWLGNPSLDSNENEKPQPIIVAQIPSSWNMVINGKSIPWSEVDIASAKKVCKGISKSLHRHIFENAKRADEETLYSKNSSDLLTIFNPDFSIKAVSSSVQQLLGYSKEEFQRLWPGIIHLKHQSNLKEKFKNFLSGKTAQDKFLFRVKHASGKYYFFESVLTDYRENNLINGIICNARNVHLRVLTQKRIRKLEKLMEISTNGVLILNPTPDSLSVAYANPAFEDITGFKAHEVIGNPFPFLEYDGINNQAIHQLKKSFKNEENCDVILQCKRKNETAYYWNYVQIAPVFDSILQDTSFIVVMTDITYRRETEEKLETYMNQLERSNDELQTFAYVASHDLQEPLRTIAGFTELIAETHQGQLDEETDEYIDFILQATTRMRTLIQDLLLFSRVSTAKEYITEVDLNEILSTALKNLNSSIEDTQAVVTYDLLPNVFTNQTMILQVFQNLLSNGLKYSKEEINPKIHISATDNEHTWTFSFKDNGIGIDSQYFDRIFIIFQRLHTKEEYSGTGIGLAICKKIVERYGGKIWLESIPDKGTTFYFTIPKELNLQ